MSKQSSQYALKQILAGRSAADIARELGIDQNILTQRLRKLPEYREYRQKQKATREKLKQKVLKRVLAGETLRDVARDMGLSEGKVNKWLQAMPEYRKYREQARVDEDIPCPNCCGVMVKQELYYWRCECGAEWWPPEKAIPDNPDEWTLTPLARFTGDKDAIAMMQRLYQAGKNYTEIAQALNEAGLYNQSGAPWKVDNLRFYMQLHGIAVDRTEQREKVLKIVEQMAGKIGINCSDIAERLNALGLRTIRNAPWNEHSVREVIRGSLKLDVSLYTKGLTIKTPTGKPHPWRRDENIRWAKIKARHEK